MSQAPRAPVKKCLPSKFESAAAMASSPPAITEPASATPFHRSDGLSTGSEGFGVIVSVVRLGSATTLSDVGRTGSRAEYGSYGGSPPPLRWPHTLRTRQ